MNKYINPFIDWSFKRIFGTENVKDILIGFLNAYRLMTNGFIYSKIWRLWM